ncbi:MAG: Gfo/Idh/MocA family oxidoreductase [Erythrobacter sp.]|nr:Gfo/Idh/MocA family oxidoreductase [Erythrobacter sp.]
MRVGIIGCGYVFDHYMSTMERHEGLEIAGVTDLNTVRLEQATAFYGLKAYPDMAAMLADDTIGIIVNLTSIEAHYDVTKAALLAGKHIYSEKPFVTDLAQARELFALAESRGLRISCAPSNALSATSQTMWKAVHDGTIGDVRMIYAEFDDNPIYLMSPEGWQSRSGAPWPYLHEYEMGCTWEHVGYHLTWMCALFGPVRHVTAFSKKTLPDKTSNLLHPENTPDFSVACLDFQSGVVGRVTCSIAVPYDHRMRIIGNRGMLHADTYRHYECPVYLEPFSKLSLNARKARSVRTNTLLQWLFGVNGRRIPLVSIAPPGSKRWKDLNGSWFSPRALIQRLKGRQLGQQDKAIGLAELADAIETGRGQFPAHDFTLHLTELTLAIQAAGPNGACHALETSFDPLDLPARTAKAGPDYARYARHGMIAKISAKLLDRLHRH